jgi:hypothetical protein
MDARGSYLSSSSLLEIVGQLPSPYGGELGK